MSNVVTLWLSVLVGGEAAIIFAALLPYVHLKMKTKPRPAIFSRHYPSKGGSRYALK